MTQDVIDYKRASKTVAEFAGGYNVSSAEEPARGAPAAGGEVTLIA